MQYRELCVNTYIHFEGDIYVALRNSVMLTACRDPGTIRANTEGGEVLPAKVHHYSDM